MLLLENTRFEPGEEANDAELARQVAAYGDIFVLDAFGCCHRDQATVTGVARRMLPRAWPGLLVRRELRYLSQALYRPDRPFAVVVGGAKVADKIGVLVELIDKADKVCARARIMVTEEEREGRQGTEKGLIDRRTSVGTRRLRFLVASNEAAGAEPWRAAIRGAISGAYNVPDAPARQVERTHKASCVRVCLSWRPCTPWRTACVRTCRPRALQVLIGGKMAFTFLAAQGVSVGRSAVEQGWIERARRMLVDAKAKVRFEHATHVWQRRGHVRATAATAAAEAHQGAHQRHRDGARLKLAGREVWSVRWPHQQSPCGRERSRSARIRHRA